MPMTRATLAGAFRVRVVSLLILRLGDFPRPFVYLGFAAVAALLVIYFGRLIIYNPKSPGLLTVALRLEHGNGSVCAHNYVNVEVSAGRLSPHEETPTGWAARFHPADYDDASWAMIELLENEKKLTRLDAYALASMVMDCRLAAPSGEQKAVHCLVPKSTWVAAR